MKKIGGDIFRRVELNYSRLSDPIYSYPKVFEHNSDWAGDYEGRAILALTSLYDALEGHENEQKQIDNQLKDIFSHIDEYLNADYYFGELFQNEIVDEQQLSGNSWYIRGLISYYKHTKEEKYLKQIINIVEKYLLPVGEHYTHYPACKRALGGVGGHMTGELIDGWKVSTDVGCAFIALDAYTDAYELLKDERLKKIIEKIIDKFLTIDFVDVQCQTHATLSCTRGIARFYQTTKEKKYLDFALSIFDKYISFGQTLDYSNFNWFGREGTWTEPCCIVDSMILCEKFYEITKSHKYLKLLNRIFANSIRTFQRINGGAGCSTCTYDGHYLLQSHLYEADFCCTMRLGEGFRFLTNHLIINQNKEYEVLLPCDFSYSDENIDIEVKYDYYNEKNLYIKVNKMVDNVSFKMYIPKFAKTSCPTEQEFIVLSPSRPGKLCVDVSLIIQKENDLFHNGDMILTKKAIEDKPFFIVKGDNFTPIYDNSQFSKEELQKRVQYVK